MSGNFVVYLIGYIIAIVGVAYALSAAGVGQEWIIAAALILIGLGIVYALSRSQRDTHSRSSAQTPNQQVVNQSSPGPESRPNETTSTRTTNY